MGVVTHTHTHREKERERETSLNRDIGGERTDLKRNKEGKGEEGEAEGTESNRRQRKTEDRE